MQLVRKNKKRLMTTLLVCSGLVAAGGAFAQQATADGKVRCNIATAEAMTSVEDICQCQIVTRGMLSYLRRQDDFLTILEETNEMCPGLAALLVDVPVAAAPVATPEDGGGTGLTGSPQSTGGGNNGEDPKPGNGPKDPKPGNGPKEDKGNKGHGQAPGGYNEDNPGKSTGRNPNSLKMDDDCDDDGNRGHGNDADGVDSGNPGKSAGTAAAASANEVGECD